MTANAGEPVYLTVLIPLYNEEDNVELLYKALSESLSKFKRSYEVILVDDGSRDRTLENLLKFQHLLPQTRIVEFRRNFGQTSAMQAGFDLAIGEIIITLDGDLQNDPSDIQKLVDKMEEGYDIVSGWRVDRQDTKVTRVLPSMIANGMIRKLSRDGLHDHGCTLKAYRKDILSEVRIYGEQHRFIPALASLYGARITEVPVKHHPRRFGKAKYGISRVPRVFLDLIMLKFLMTYSQKPLQVFGLIGLVSSILGAGVCAWLTIDKLVFNRPLAERPLLLLGVLLIVFGVQFISTGILAEMLSRTYHEASRRSTYAIRKIHDWSSSSQPEKRIASGKP